MFSFSELNTLIVQKATIISRCPRLNNTKQRWRTKGLQAQGCAGAVDPAGTARAVRARPRERSRGLPASFRPVRGFVRPALVSLPSVAPLLSVAVVWCLEGPCSQRLFSCWPCRRRPAPRLLFRWAGARRPSPRWRGGLALYTHTTHLSTAFLSSPRRPGLDTRTAHLLTFLSSPLRP